MPDIDIDFCYEHRKVIRYVVDNAGRPCSPNRDIRYMAARGAIRDVGRVMDLPYQKVDRVAKMVPAELNITLHRALEIGAT